MIDVVKSTNYLATKKWIIEGTFYGRTVYHQNWIVFSFSQESVIREIYQDNHSYINKLKTLSIIYQPNITIISKANCTVFVGKNTELQNITIFSWTQQCVFRRS